MVKYRVNVRLMPLKRLVLVFRHVRSFFDCLKKWSNLTQKQLRLTPLLSVDFRPVLTVSNMANALSGRQLLKKGGGGGGYPIF